MPAIELRLIIYAVLSLGLLGGAGWTGYKITSMHYETVMGKDQTARDTAVQTAELNVIALQKERDTLKQQVEKDHALMVQTDATARDAILGSVRGLEDALHLGAMSRPMDHSGKPGGAGAGTSSNSEISNLIGQLNDSFKEALAGCQHDSTELTGILAIAPKAPISIN